MRVALHDNSGVIYNEEGMAGDFVNGDPMTDEIRAAIRAALIA